MGKLKLLFIAEELQINGAVTSLLALLNALPQELYDISLFLFRPGGNMMHKIPDHIKVLPASLPYVAHRMPVKSAVKQMLSKGRPDLAFYRLLVSAQRLFKLKYRFWGFLPNIESTYDVACCYTDGFAAPMMIRKVTSSKKVAWIHFTYSDWDQGKYVYDALKKCDLCVPVSIEAGKDLDHVVGLKLKKRLVHNITDQSRCISLAQEECEIPRKNNTYRIVTVGRITVQKNVNVILPTAQLLKSHGIDFEWYVIGDGDLFGQLSTIAQNMNPPSNVHFIGPRANPMPWVMSADVIVNPSRYEAWGMTVSEALCLGKAVITSDIPVFAEQITNGENGMMCKATAEILSKTIAEVLSDKELRNRLETNARNYKFTKEYIVDEFNDMISSLME